MALQIHSPSSSSSFTIHKPYHHLLLLAKPKSKLSIIKSQNTEQTPENPNPPKNPKPDSPGLGFGSPSSSGSSASASGKANATTAVSKKKKIKSKRERAAIIRRAPVENPRFISKEDEAKANESMKNESAFLLAWLGLGGIILLQGIALAASGFLPERLDNLFAKYLYPSFTPTVALFVTGTVAYGVLKYLQNENLDNQN